ncbi:hypothetical protein ABH920_005358 [Catenulispora sp. EB89]|uniref:HAAS signaling domain-containing protein n=1 Tax=Catenulispora sp. EB89 TaxID=3156257 RepID=UPI003515502D
MSSQEFEGVDGDGPGGVGGVGGLGGAGGLGGLGGDSPGGDAGGSGDEVAGYAAEVRAQFTDLPDDESADLLEDLEDHLREVAAEDAGTLRERLGAPAEYARELRQAAGLPGPGEGSGSGGPRGSGAGSRPRRPLRSRLRQAMADAEQRARRYRAGREVLDFLPSLRPAWWVLRAWVAVRLLEAMTTTAHPWHEITIIPQVGNSTFVGLLALLVAIPASVYAARQTVPDGWRRRAMGAGEGILVLFTVGMALSAIGNQGDRGDMGSGVSYVQQSQSGLVEDGKPISNLYVYDQSGKQLNGVFVYDQDGMPVEPAPFAVESYIDGDAWLDGNGTAITNLFPRHLLQQRWGGDGNSVHLVAVPPPVVDIPQGVHREPGPDDPQQGSATPSTTPTGSTPSGPPATSTSASPSGSASPGATGAQTTSALPTTPTPSGTKG